MAEHSDPTGPRIAAGLTNTTTRFGSVAKALHWLTALLILTMIPLGVAANFWGYDTSEALATKATLFSVHKTLGLVTFAVALLRIGWALTQPRPAMLPMDSKIQGFAAEAVHWALYGALVLVPLSGWIHHAATTGFAPIWWPFGQTLFFVPQSPGVAQAFAGLHFAFNILLVLALVLHVGGALKHHVIDKDATLKRMLPGSFDLPDAMQQPQAHRRPALAAVGVWSLAVVAGLGIGMTKDGTTPASAALEQVASEWSVQDGSLKISVLQLGQAVEGEFADWTAAIEFRETAADGVHGAVSVTVATGSLTLGSVTKEALAPEFLASEAFPTAVFAGPITADGDSFRVDGTFTMVGQTQPLSLVFTLELEGDTAQATGTTRLDRRDFGMGQTYGDESTVGFAVDIQFDLTAVRGG